MEKHDYNTLAYGAGYREPARLQTADERLISELIDDDDW